MTLKEPSEWSYFLLLVLFIKNFSKVFIEKKREKKRLQEIK